MSLSYEEFVGLQLNTHRVIARRSYDLANAVAVGSARRKLPPEWLQWIADYPHEAAALQAQVDAETLRR